MTVPSTTFTMRIEMRYRLLEVVIVDGRRVARIETRAINRMEYGPTSPLASIASPMLTETTGEMEFDVDRGILVRSSTRGTSTRSVGGISFQSETLSVRELVPR